MSPVTAARRDRLAKDRRGGGKGRGTIAVPNKVTTTTASMIRSTTSEASAAVNGTTGSVRESA
jgi:hypothetical protein